MKTWLIVIMLALVCTAYGQNNVPITQLPYIESDSIMAGDFSPVVHNGRYYRVTVGALDSTSSTISPGYWSLNSGRLYNNTGSSFSLGLSGQFASSAMGGDTLSMQLGANSVTGDSSITLAVGYFNTGFGLYYEKLFGTNIVEPLLGGTITANQVGIGDANAALSGSDDFRVDASNPGTFIVHVGDSINPKHGYLTLWNGSVGGGRTTISMQSGTSNHLGLAFPNTSGNAGDVLETDGTVNGSLSWVSGVQTAKIHITSAQLLSAHSSPTTLIPAPGTGKFINILGITDIYNYGSSAYTGSSLYISEGDNASDWWDIPGIVTLTSSSRGEGFVGSYQTATIANSAVTLSGAADLTSGNGTLDIYITYMITSQ